MWNNLYVQTIEEIFFAPEISINEYYGNQRELIVLRIKGLLHELKKHPGFGERMSKEEINTFPLQKWEGPIRVIQTREELDDVVNKLNRQNCLGFDTETRPAFHKGQHFLPSLLQLANDEEVYLFQLKKIGLMKPLLAILSDPDVAKVGVSLDYDLKELQKISPFQPAGFIDIGKMARKMGIKNHGLRGLAAVLLGIRLSKTAQRSNWSRNTLTSAQIHYAATDAWVGREIYLKMLHFAANRTGAARDC